MTKHTYYVPIRVTQTGYAVVQAYGGEAAIDTVESGGFDIAECIAAQVEGVEVIGPPIEETVN